jgi:hypothetical protein
MPHASLSARRFSVVLSIYEKAELTLRGKLKNGWINGEKSNIVLFYAS